MKRLQHLCLTSILFITLTIPTFAGDINCGIVSSSPPQTSVTGEMANGATAMDETADAETLLIDPVTGLALDILQSLLTLF